MRTAIECAYNKSYKANGTNHRTPLVCRKKTKNDKKKSLEKNTIWIAGYPFRQFQSHRTNTFIETDGPETEGPPSDCIGDVQFDTVPIKWHSATGKSYYSLF